MTGPWIWVDRVRSTFIQSFTSSLFPSDRSFISHTKAVLHSVWLDDRRISAGLGVMKVHREERVCPLLDLTGPLLHCDKLGWSLPPASHTPLPTPRGTVHLQPEGLTGFEPSNHVPGPCCKFPLGAYSGPTQVTRSKSLHFGPPPPLGPCQHSNIIDIQGAQAGSCHFLIVFFFFRFWSPSAA